MKEYQGILEAEETPTGIKWHIYTGNYLKREWSREFLIPVETGDHLIILNYTRTKLWEGVIKFEDSPQGWDMNISYPRWEKFFFKAFSAILTKHE